MTMKSVVTMTSLFFTLAASGLASGHGRGHHAPSWPKGYTYEFSKKTLYDIQMSYKVYVSHGKNKLKFEINNGTNAVFVDVRREDVMVYWYVPAYINNTNQRACFYNSTSFSFAYEHYLPDLSSFKYAGKERFRGIETEKWEYKNDDDHFHYEDTVWIKYHNSSPIPVSREYRFYGLDGGYTWKHDFYDYYNYKVGEPSQTVWDRPKRIYCVSNGYTPHNIITGHETHPKELGMRKNLLIERSQMVEAHNREASSYKLEMNQFAFLTDEELRRYSGCGKTTKKDQHLDSFPYTDEEVLKLAKYLPESFDWRLQGAVSPVKNQGPCGSCWTFGITEAMEGFHFKKTNQLEEMTEQFIIDCAWLNRTDGPQSRWRYMAGCWGGLGWNDEVLKWIRKTGGMARTVDYGPFLEINSYCHMNKSQLIAPLKKFTAVTNTTEALKVALYHHGPIVVEIQAPIEMLFYRRGVFKPKNPHTVDGHVVLVVGYGSLLVNYTTHTVEEPYWIVKNSFGANWGEDGYILISSVGNTIGILDNAVVLIS